MDDKRVIASSIADNEVVRAFSEFLADRWGDWDLSPFMAYLVDICAPSVLPYLADQFDIDGLRGFKMATTEQQRRDLIKQSIALHKYLGTPWAIREACRTVGFPIINIDEGVTAIPGGPESPEDWARFSVLIETEDSRPITAEEARQLRLFIDFYKNERSHLVELGFNQTLSDENVYSDLVDQRENFQLLIARVYPNPVVMNMMGDMVAFVVDCPDEWRLVQSTINWPDETGDTLSVSYSGEAGKTIVRVTSSSNNTGVTRRAEVFIETSEGQMLDPVVIEQLSASVNNAYGPAYSSAYNNLQNVEVTLLVAEDGSAIITEDKNNLINVHPNG